MSTANLTPHTSLQELVEQRLDAIDQALLGLLPRQERVAAVSQLEARIREVVPADLALIADSTAASRSRQPAAWPMPTAAPTWAPHPQFFGPSGSGPLSWPQSRMSRLALSAGVLGLLAFVLLLATPVTYFAAEILSDIVGEIVAIGLLGAEALAVTVGGIAAVGLGIAALVSIGRQRGRLVGRGWAVAGLCTGAMPMLLGSVAVLMTVLQFGMSQFVSITEAPPVATATEAHASAKADSDEDDGPVAELPPPMAARVPTYITPDGRAHFEPVAQPAPAGAPDAISEATVRAALEAIYGGAPVGAPDSTPAASSNSPAAPKPEAAPAKDPGAQPPSQPAPDANPTPEAVPTPGPAPAPDKGPAV